MLGNSGVAVKGTWSWLVLAAFQALLQSIANSTRTASPLRSVLLVFATLAAIKENARQGYIVLTVS